MGNNVKIDVLDDGPLIIDKLETLTNSKGENVDIDEKIALCRCGHSENKPFCDGSHKKVEFSGNRESNASFSKERAYEGKDITIHDNRTICCHAGECVSGLNSVFDINTNPWINPDNATVSQVIEVVLIECERPILTNLDQLTTDDIDVFGLPVRSQAHDLVLTGIYFEAGEVCEGRVQESEGIGPMDLTPQLDFVVTTQSKRSGCPFSDPIDGQDRRFLKR